MVDVEQTSPKWGSDIWCGAIVAKEGRRIIAVHQCYFVEGKNVVWDFLSDHPIKTLITQDEFRAKVRSFEKRGFHIYAKGYGLEAAALSGVPNYKGWERDHELGTSRVAFEEKGGFILHDLKCAPYDKLIQWYGNHEVVRNMIARYKTDYQVLEYGRSSHVPVVECIVFLYHWEMVTEFLYQLQRETKMLPKYRGEGGAYDLHFYRNMLQADWGYYDRRIAIISWHSALWEHEKMGGPVMVALTRMVGQRNAILRRNDRSNLVEGLETYQPHVLSKVTVFEGGGALRWKWILEKDVQDYLPYVRNCERLPIWWNSQEEVQQYRSEYQLRGLRMKDVYARDAAMVALLAYMLSTDEDFYEDKERQEEILKTFQAAPETYLMVIRRGNLRRIPYVTKDGVLLSTKLLPCGLEDEVFLREQEDLERVPEWYDKDLRLREWKECKVKRPNNMYQVYRFRSSFTGICDIYPEDLPRAPPEFDLIYPLEDGGSRNVYKFNDGTWAPIRMSRHIPRNTQTLLLPPIPKSKEGFKAWLAEHYPQIPKDPVEFGCWFNS